MYSPHTWWVNRGLPPVSPPPTRLPMRSLRSSSPESPASRPSPIRTRSRRSIPALLPSPPPTQFPTWRSSSLESPAGRRLASASRSWLRFVYVEVPPRSQKWALSPDDASSDIANCHSGIFFAFFRHFSTLFICIFLDFPICFVPIPLYFSHIIWPFILFNSCNLNLLF